uniref:Transposase n=1 Tax=Steinernema glaseri TaxID=37863 RepID=A0A1I7ZR75_9BILA
MEVIEQIDACFSAILKRLMPCVMPAWAAAMVSGYPTLPFPFAFYFCPALFHMTLGNNAERIRDESGTMIAPLYSRLKGSREPYYMLHVVAQQLKADADSWG